MTRNSPVLWLDCRSSQWCSLSLFQYLAHSHVHLPWAFSATLQPLQFSPFSPLQCVTSQSDTSMLLIPKINITYLRNSFFLIDPRPELVKILAQWRESTILVWYSASAQSRYLITASIEPQYNVNRTSKWCETQKQPQNEVKISQKGLK